MLASWLQDLRSGIRLLRRDFVISALIVGVLSLGIGGTSAMFTLLKAAFLDPLPYREGNRLITILDDNGWNPSSPEFVQIRNRSTRLKQIAFAEYRDMQLSGTEEPTRVFAARVTASFFPLLGVKAEFGRIFDDQENDPNRLPVVLLTDRYWRTRMGGDQNVVGRVLRLDGQPAQIVGILPPDFHFDYPTLRIPEPVEIYVACALDTNATFRSGGFGFSVSFRTLARLAEHTTPEQAQSELDSIALALAHDYPTAYRTREGKPRAISFEAVPLREAIVGRQRAFLWLLFGGATILLLVACANAAQLLFARSVRRGPEMAIRTALGASRARLIRQFLLESLIPGLCSGGLGLLIAAGITHVILWLLPVASPIFDSAHIDMRVLGFAFTASLIAVLLSSLAPTLHGSVSTLRPVVGSGTMSTDNRWRHVLMAIEATLSAFLLCGAGLVTWNLWKLISVPVGFDPSHVLTMQLKLSGRQPNALDASASAVLQEYLAKVQAIPGVESAATVTGPPLRPSRSGPVEIIGVTDSSGGLKSIITEIHLISPDYFRTLRIPLLAGRTFNDDDRTGRPRVMIVNQEFARQFGLSRDIVGKQTYEPGEPFTIVGMVGNVRARGLETAPVPETYLSSKQLDWANVYLMVRSTLPAPQLLRRVKAAIQSTNTDQPVYGELTMDELLANSMTEPRFNVFVICTFAFLAVVMVAGGIYSVIALLVSQRTKEIAIRIALGAGHNAIARAVLGPTLAWVMAGLTCGVGLGLVASTTIRSLTNSEAGAGPAVYFSIVVFFLVVTLLATYRPLRRAHRVDPAIALRAE